MSAIFGETLTFPQGQGPEVELVVFGDEYYSRRETTDGYTAIYDDELGLYCYAVLKAGQFESSGLSIASQPPSSLPYHLEESEHIRHQKFSKRYAQMRPTEGDTSFDQSL